MVAYTQADCTPCWLLIVQLLSFQVPLLVGIVATKAPKPYLITICGTTVRVIHGTVRSELRLEVVITVLRIHNLPLLRDASVIRPGLNSGAIGRARPSHLHHQAGGMPALKLIEAASHIND